MKQPVIRPLSNYVLGLQQKTSNKTASGLILPETAQKRTSITEVLGIGPDVENVKIGDQILFKEYTQHEISFEGEDYVLVEEADVLACMGNKKK